MNQLRRRLSTIPLTKLSKVSHRSSISISATQVSQRSFWTSLHPVTRLDTSNYKYSSTQSISLSTMSETESKKEPAAPVEQTEKSTTGGGDNQSDKKKNNRNNNKRKFGGGKYGKNKRMGKDNNKKNKQKTTVDFKARNQKRDEVHQGSYAHKAMRDLFNESLPEMDKLQAEQAELAEKGETKAEYLENNSSEPKVPKRKVALLIQFIGTKYCGMQINEGQQTIQSEIELALYKAGLLAATNFGIPGKYSWSNSARTDKGVHSCAQVCSCKILLPTEDLNEIREMINKELPDDINIADVVRTSKTFCARTQRDKVRYQYILPSFALSSSESVQEIFDKVMNKEINEKERNLKDPFTKEEKIALQNEFRKIRVDTDALDKLKEALGTYEGTHKFHNYTSGKTFNDANASRYILSFTVQDPVVDKHGMEWIPCQVVGQSFLLHQIRKMMSMAMDAARGSSSTDIMKQSFTDKYMNVNTAPAQGLFLDMSYFESFNRRPNAGDPLDWHSDPTSPATQRWKEFKEGKVMTHIMDEEERQGNFVDYLYTQENHNKYANYDAVDEKKSKRDN